MWGQEVRETINKLCNVALMEIKGDNTMKDFYRSAENELGLEAELVA